MKLKGELSNHLGNVLAVVSDRKFATGGGTEIYNKQFTNTTITNNTVEGWTGYSGVTISNANNQIGFTTTNQYAGIRTVIPTVAGESYEIKFNFTMTPPYPGNQGGGLAAKDGTTDENLNGMWMNQNATGSNKYGFVFRAKSSSTALNLFNGNIEGVSGSFAIDNVVITTVAHYEAEILMSSDYQIYHGIIEDRQFSAQASTYRYRGANGQENDDEIAEGISTAEYWEYDSRTARRWNVDPQPKIHESPYACFANNPIWLKDVNGADTTFNVRSASIDNNGNKLVNDDGTRTFNTPLLLFKASVAGGENVEIDIDINKFNDNYQTLGKYISFSYEGKDISKPFANVFFINNENPHFSNAVKTVTLEELNAAKDNAVSSWKRYQLKDPGQVDPSLFKLMMWEGGAPLDTKADGKLFDGFPMVYVKDVGIFRGDVLGNVVYGGAWCQFQGAKKTLFEGDFIQGPFNYNGTNIRDEVDDPQDGYGLILGHITNGGVITKSILLNKEIHFSKTVVVEKGLVDDVNKINYIINDGKIISTFNYQTD